MTTVKAPLFPRDLREIVGKSRVLLVGAGGIGCEVLKNLVLSGFMDIEVIDLDTIDVSNLNRQFLFRREHVGKSKAEVACESVSLYNPDVKIKPHHDSIISHNYGVTYMQKFNVVLNALDNRSARNQVNRVCLSANVPLVESGTSGYLGQVELIYRDKTKCYECEPKAPPKTYPGCTIRNTPSEHVHCIVWSKNLFNQLFGIVDEDEDVSPDFEDKETPNGSGDPDDGAIKRVSTRKWAAMNGFNHQKIFTKLFKDDIDYLLSMSDLWQNRTPPQPISWEEALTLDATESENQDDRELSIWSIKECAEVFANCMSQLSSRFEDCGELTWDKDDPVSMDFVTACSNIRAHIFHIDKKSRFATKSVAGNIIPAIATANAIIAGYVVLQAMKVLQNQIDKCQSVYLRRFPNPRGQLVVPEKQICPPIPTCIVCSYKPQVKIRCNIHKLTCKDFEVTVLKKALNLPAPDVMLAARGTIIISSEDADNVKNHEKPLCDIGVGDGAVLLIDDFLQNYKLEVIILHTLEELENHPGFAIVGFLGDLTPRETTDNGSGAGDQAKDDYISEDDDLEIMDQDVEEESRKRTADEIEEVSEVPTKKLKVTDNAKEILPSTSNETIEISGGEEDEEEASILPAKEPETTTEEVVALSDPVTE